MISLTLDNNIYQVSGLESLAQLFSLIYIPVISNQIQDLESITWLTSVLNILEGLVCFGFVI